MRPEVEQKGVQTCTKANRAEDTKPQPVEAPHSLFLHREQERLVWTWGVVGYHTQHQKNKAEEYWQFITPNPGEKNGIISCVYYW